MTPATAAARAAAPQRAPRSRPDSQPARPGEPRHLAVVRQRPRRRRTRLAVAVTLLVSLVAVFGLAAFHVFLVQSQFQLERIETQLEDERAEFERLRLEATRLSSPERILSIARTDLGMVDPEAVEHLTAPSHGDPAEDTGQGARAWAEVKPYLAAQP